MKVVHQGGIIEGTEYEMPRHCANSPRRDTGRSVPMCPHSTPSPIDPAIRIEGDLVHVPLRSNRYPGHHTTVDIDDLDKVNNIKWTVRITGSGQVHARRGVRRGDKVDTVYLHHEIAGTPPDGFVVGHIDGNSLNNTRANLHIVTKQENFQRAWDIHRREAIEIFNDKRNPCGGVYLVKAGDRYKIGVSSNPGQRVAALNTASPYPIEIVHIERTANYRAVEKDIHELYAAYRELGEWFDFEERMIPIVIRTIQTGGER